MAKPRKPWMVVWSTSEPRREYTSEAAAYRFVADCRQFRADGLAGIRSEVKVYQHDGSDWRLYERVDLAEG